MAACVGPHLLYALLEIRTTQLLRGQLIAHALCLTPATHIAHIICGYACVRECGHVHLNVCLLVYVYVCILCKGCIGGILIIFQIHESKI